MNYRDARCHWLFACLMAGVPLMVCCAAALGSDACPLYRNWRIYTPADGLPDADVRALVVDDECLWVGTGRGLARFCDGAWTAWSKSEGIPPLRITCLAMDSINGELWVGTLDKGLFRFSGGRFDRFDQMNSGMAGNVVFSLAVGEGRIWAATNGGLSVYEPRRDRWDLYFERKWKSPDVAGACLHRGKSSLYLGTWRGPVYEWREEGSVWSPIAPPRSLNRDDYAQVLASPGALTVGRSLWWSIGPGVFAHSVHAEWRYFALPGSNEREAAHITFVAENPRGEPWVGSTHGAYAMVDAQPERWVRYARSAGSEGGIIEVFQAGRVVHSWQLPEVLPDNHARCIAFQADRVWIGTARGLAVGTGLHYTALAETVPAAIHAEEAPPGTVSQQVSPPVALKAQRPRGAVLGVWWPGSTMISRSSPNLEGKFEKDRPNLQAVALRVRQVHEARSRRGLGALSIVTGFEQFRSYGWTLPEDDLVQFAADSRILAVVAHLGDSDPIGELVSSRAEVPVLDIARPLNGSRVRLSPWIFHCWADIPMRHRMMLDHLNRSDGVNRIVIVRGPGEFVMPVPAWWRDHWQSAGRTMVADVMMPCEESSWDMLASTIETGRADAVLAWAMPGPFGVMVRRLRDAGIHVPLVGGEHIRAEIERLGLGAGIEPGAVIALLPHSPSDDEKRARWFASTYSRQLGNRRHKAHGASQAYPSYLAADHIVDVIDRCDGTRAGLRGTLEAMRISSRGEEHYERSHPDDPGVLPRIARWKKRQWHMETLGPAVDNEGR